MSVAEAEVIVVWSFCSSEVEVEVVSVDETAVVWDGFGFLSCLPVPVVASDSEAAVRDGFASGRTVCVSCVCPDLCRERERARA
jgi:hypothetical protein